MTLVPLGELPSDLLFGESSSLGAQHLRNLDLLHPDLVPQWDETLGEMIIVLPQ